MAHGKMFLLLLLTIEGISAAITQSERDTILDLHNQLRGQVSPTASDMLKMVWDSDLEYVAQRWADNCQWAHNGDRSSWYSSVGGSGNVGENLYASSNINANVRDGLTLWWNEYTLMSRMDGSDWQGGAGHYSQMAWHNSDRIGCGVRRSNGCAGYATYLVCNYAPSGNYIGQKTYTSGTPCSRCPSTHTSCDSNLCSTSSGSSGTSSGGSSGCGWTTAYYSSSGISGYLPSFACGDSTERAHADASDACCRCSSCNGITCAGNSCTIRTGLTILGSPSSEYSYQRVDKGAHYCNVQPSSRVDCGWPGISSSECVSRGCCFDSTITDTKWCFYQNRLKLLDDGERIPGIPDVSETPNHPTPTGNITSAVL